MMSVVALLLADIVPQQDQFSESGCSSHKADVRVDSSSLYQQDDLPESRHSIDSFSTENSQELPPRTGIQILTIVSFCGVFGIFDGKL